jgi:hypothetical protein
MEGRGLVQDPMSMDFGLLLISKARSCLWTTCTLLLLFSLMARGLVWIEKKTTLNGVSTHVAVPLLTLD